jgi:hypothetical protein
MPITLTPAQAAALARIAGDDQVSLRLHQIGEDPDVLVTWCGATEPRLLLRPDGGTDPLPDHARHAVDPPGLR